MGDPRVLILRQGLIVAWVSLNNISLGSSCRELTLVLPTSSQQ